MKITLIAEDGIRLEPIPGPMTIEAQSAEQQYSPFHMLASGLAFCTYSVLASWASHAKLDAEQMAIEIRWTFAENPHRVGALNVKIDWPSLPAERAKAARRVSGLCAIHATLSHPPAIETVVVSGGVATPVSAEPQASHDLSSAVATSA